MRVLWFSVTPSMFVPHSNGHNGGGWISSLEHLLHGEKSIDLGIAFNYPSSEFRHEKNGVIYYPIPLIKKSLFEMIFHRKNLEEVQVAYYLRIIDDFKPDVIQIFGSENDFGLICDKVDVPVIIHIQGSMPPYHNALFPIGMNELDFYRYKGLNWRRRLMGIRSEVSFRTRAEREIKILQSCRYFMGRTEWDKSLVKLFNPNAEYFHCEEALRDSFIQSGAKWNLLPGGKINIVSVISNPWYKGVDLILKSAKLLKEFIGLNYVWNVYGVNDIRFFEYKYGIKASDVNVQINGVVNKNELVQVLSTASCYVHPSYIDNSPNSICEAQYIGIPVLATFVGGIPSLVEHGKTGLLFPANDPYTLASLIKEVTGNNELSISLSENEREVSRQRHNPQMIKERLLSIYKQLLS